MVDQDYKKFLESSKHDIAEIAARHDGEPLKLTAAYFIGCVNASIGPELWKRVSSYPFSKFQSDFYKKVKDRLQRGGISLGEPIFGWSSDEDEPHPPLEEPHKKFLEMAVGNLRKIMRSQGDELEKIIGSYYAGCADASANPQLWKKVESYRPSSELKREISARLY